VSYECLNVEDAVGFEWDDGNVLKNEIKHGLSWQRIEEVFFRRTGVRRTGVR